jgi:Domain of unknown function (DUF932)
LYALPVADGRRAYCQPLRTTDGHRAGPPLRQHLARGRSRRQRRHRERASGIIKLWKASPTIAPIAGTRWAAYNAVTEYRGYHVAPIRGARTACDASAARALRGISAAANTQSMKAQAFRMLQTL